MSLSPSLAEVIGRVLDSKIADLRTFFPATVLSYDSATQTARLRAGVTSAVPTFDDEDVDAIEKLPDFDANVIWPGGGTSWLICNLAPGDAVLACVPDTDLAAWWRTGTAGEPEDRNKHNLSLGAFALPVIRRPGAQIDSPQPSMQLGSAGDAVALASALDGALSAVAAIPPLPPVPSEADLIAWVNAFKACFAAWMNPAYSCGSSMIKVQE